MSGEGATGQVYDATGSVISISDARGSQKLFNPSDIKAPEIQEIKNEGDIIQFKIWLRLITLLLSSAGMDVVLYAEVYDPTSVKHREALSLLQFPVDPTYATHRTPQTRCVRPRAASRRGAVAVWPR